jgi:glycosyltransferase involved in cell wall biosynthesis
LSDSEPSTGTQAPVVSVVLPAWDRYAQAPLLEALESLRGQDLEAQLIVVDNASESPLPELTDVDLVRAPRRLTVGAARNLGLESVRAPYVVFWDADDLMPPGTLRFLYESISNRSDVVAVSCSILEDEPRVRHRWPRRWARHLARSRRVFAFANSVWSVFPTVGGTLMRTDAVRACGGYADIDGGEDWVLGVSLGFRGQIELHERPGRIYGRRVGSMWEGWRSLPQLTHHAAEVRQRMGSDPGVPPWARRLLPLVAALQLGALAVHEGRHVIRGSATPKV